MGLAEAASMTRGPRRVGLFGGSFDPVHLAHLSLARVAMSQLALDELRWVPAGQPWQKAGREVTPAAHREAMVRLMIEGIPGFVLDRSELLREGPSYTVDTVRALAAENPAAARPRIFLVIGQDQYARLHTWHDWQGLLQEATLAVAARQGEGVRAPEALAGISHQVVRLEMPALNISSSAVRASVSRGENIRPMVGDAVAEYIALHRLY